MALDAADLFVKSIREPDRTTEFLDGSVRAVVELGTVAVGHGIYQPGWQWSRHVGPIAGVESQRHVGYILSGRMCVRSRDGVEVHLGPQEAFEADEGHDAWVEGTEPCVALDWTLLDG